MDQSYFEKEYKAQKTLHNQYIESTVKEFNLNNEQERAFRIIANHAESKTNPQLKMYIGGMGGTGKSRGIKALVSFFEK